MFKKLHITNYFNLLTAGLHRIDFVVSLFVVVINILYRLPYLASSGLWYDEVFSVYHSQFNFAHIFATCNWDVSPPGYYFVLNIWMKVFGNSEYSVRFLSVLFMGLTAGILYLFSKKFFNVHIGIFVLLLFLSSDRIYFYSHETRAYAMLCFLTSILFYLIFLHCNSPSKKNSFLIGATMAFMFYSHYLSALLFIPLLIFFLIRIKKYVHLVFLATGFFLIMGHWLKRSFEVMVGGGTGWNTFVPQMSDLLHTFRTFFVGNEAVYLSAILIVLGFYSLKINRQYLFSVFLFLSSAIGTLLLFYFGSKISPMWIDRYFLFVLIPFYIMLSVLLFSISVNIYIKYAVVLFIAVNGMCQTTFNIAPRMDYKNGIAFVKDSLETEDSKIILQTVDVMSTFSYYYDKDIFARYDIKNALVERGVYPMSDTVDMHLYNISDSRRIIHLQTFVSGDDQITSYLERLYSRKAKYTNYTNVTISVYEQ